MKGVDLTNHVPGKGMWRSWETRIEKKYLGSDPIKAVSDALDTVLHLRFRFRKDDENKPKFTGLYNLLRDMNWWMTLYRKKRSGQTPRIYIHLDMEILARIQLRMPQRAPQLLPSSIIRGALFYRYWKGPRGEAPRFWRVPPNPWGRYPTPGHPVVVARFPRAISPFEAKEYGYEDE